jgi:hypothetical protein
MKFQKAQRSVQLPTTGIGGGQYLIPVKINLWAMKKGSQKIPLDWKVSFTVGGVLEGKAPHIKSTFILNVEFKSICCM